MSMYRNLSPGAVGIRATFVESLDLAKGAGYEGVDLNLGEIASLVAEHSAAWVKEQFAARGLRVGGFGLPVNYRGDEAAYRADLEKLPERAALAQSLLGPRVCNGGGEADDARRVHK